MRIRLAHKSDQSDRLFPETPPPPSPLLCHFVPLAGFVPPPPKTWGGVMEEGLMIGGPRDCMLSISKRSNGTHFFLKVLSKDFLSYCSEKR